MYVLPGSCSPFLGPPTPPPGLAGSGPHNTLGRPCVTWLTASTSWNGACDWRGSVDLSMSGFRVAAVLNVQGLGGTYHGQYPRVLGHTSQVHPLRKPHWLSVSRAVCVQRIYPAQLLGCGDQAPRSGCGGCEEQLGQHCTYTSSVRLFSFRGTSIRST